MKACVIQPPYSLDLTLSDAYFAKKLEYLSQCDASMDLIVLPEYSDVPCAASSREDNLMYHHKYIDTLLSACAETARRCDAVVFVNVANGDNIGQMIESVGVAATHAADADAAHAETIARSLRPNRFDRFGPRKRGRGGGQSGGGFQKVAAINISHRFVPLSLINIYIGEK